MAKLNTTTLDIIVDLSKRFKRLIFWSLEQFFPVESLSSMCEMTINVRLRFGGQVVNNCPSTFSHRVFYHLFLNGMPVNAKQGPSISSGFPDIYIYIYIYAHTYK